MRRIIMFITLVTMALGFYSCSDDNSTEPKQDRLLGCKIYDLDGEEVTGNEITTQRENVKIKPDRFNNIYELGSFYYDEEAGEEIHKYWYFKFKPNMDSEGNVIYPDSFVVTFPLNYYKAEFTLEPSDLKWVSANDSEKPFMLYIDEFIDDAENDIYSVKGRFSGLIEQEDGGLPDKYEIRNGYFKTNVFLDE
ncbi:MAG: hypothetical protein JXR48_02255 [Candidatus Delongbacteria bacterium]|nr:hypothetical protein [Candidatus Delongbacteria bacterium]MBN2833769.1 hypothetical protein [Candidatus Delongbacteria bacterium]